MKPNNILTLHNHLTVTIVHLLFLEVNVWWLHALLSEIALQLIEKHSNFSP